MKGWGTYFYSSSALKITLSHCLLCEWVYMLQCLVRATSGNKFKKQRSTLLKFLLLCGKQLHFCWTMSRWYVTPVCLPAHSEIGNWGMGGAGKGSLFPCLMGADRPLGCLSNCPWRMLPRNLREGCGVGGVLHKQGRWKGPPFSGVME